MVKLIFNIIFLVILAVFVALNMAFKTDINLFSVELNEVSVVAVVLLSFVVGVLYSFLFYVTSFLSKMRKERIKERSVSTKKKEQELKSREKNIEKTVNEKVAAEKEKFIEVCEKYKFRK